MEKISTLQLYYCSKYKIDASRLVCTFNEPLTFNVILMIIRLDLVKLITYFSSYLQVVPCDGVEFIFSFICAIYLSAY